MSRVNECKNCCYYWYNDEYGRECCNYPSDDPWSAPCEEDDYTEEPDYMCDWEVYLYEHEMEL